MLPHPYLCERCANRLERGMYEYMAEEQSCSWQLNSIISFSVMCNCYILAFPLWLVTCVWLLYDTVRVEWRFVYWLWVLLEEWVMISRLRISAELLAESWSHDYHVTCTADYYTCTVGRLSPYRLCNYARLALMHSLWRLSVHARRFVVVKLVMCLSLENMCSNSLTC